MKHQFSIQKPYIITSGGTDINHDLLDETKKQAMKTIIDDASAVTVFTADGKEKVADAFPNMQGKISVIPQSVWFPESSNENSVELRDGFPKLLLPAGLRPVKDVLFVLEPLKKLQKEFPKLQFIIVGTILDQTVYEQVKEAEMTHPWLRFIKDIPLEKMPLYYKWADIVLNTSISEGQSSAIIEGMYFSKLIIARRNAGNVSVITDKRNGFLYDSPVDFQKRLKNVLLTMNNQADVALNGNRYVEEVHNHGKEMQQYFSLYKKII
jgi:glycosyltransferase involved in cell wall biosynthesis